MRVILKIAFILIISTCVFNAYARKYRSQYIPSPNYGNFALPGSQQVYPLISFGQAIIGQNVLQFTVPLGMTLSTQNNYSFMTGFEAIWGISDYLSLYISAPFSIRDRLGDNFSTGFNDLTFQFEGELYSYNHANYGFLWTLVGNVTAPTGSISKNPKTGLGAPSFFVGTTFSYLDPRWYAFTSYAVVFPMAAKNFQGGNQILYQAGFGRNIPTSNQYIFDWLVECDGIYSWENHVNGYSNPNSGSNLISVTPSLYLSTLKWIYQLGVGYPFVQQLNGSQPKQYLNLQFSLTYTASSAST